MGNVVENIKAIRLERAINQQLIADELGIDVSAVSNIENGKRELKVSELAKIANVLGVEVIDLFTWPKKYIDKAQLARGEQEKVSVTFEIDPKERDYLLHLVMKDQNI